MDLISVDEVGRQRKKYWTESERAGPVFKGLPALTAPGKLCIVSAAKGVFPPHRRDIKHV
jgi:hypothetical protein